MDKREEQPLRCTCSRTPVLGMVGVNEDGLLYFHKMYRRGDKIIDQTYSLNDVKTWCRICHRWWNIRINNSKAIEAKETLVPKPLTKKREETLCLPVLRNAM